eukprot:364581-Chlamydomonas_euryale.AAC.3
MHAVRFTKLLPNAELTAAITMLPYCGHSNMVNLCQWDTEIVRYGRVMAFNSQDKCRAQYMSGSEH